MPTRKTYTYGGQAKKDSGQVDWNDATNTDKSSVKSKLPQKKGIWAKASTASPFKQSPVKKNVLTIKLDDPFGFDDSENECFNFKEDGIKASPKKGKVTPSKPLSPRSPTTVNPRLLGKALPDNVVTISVDDLSPKKATKKDGKKSPPKKGSLAALQAQLQSQNKNFKGKDTKKSISSDKNLKKDSVKTPSPAKNLSLTKSIKSRKGNSGKSPVKKQETKSKLLIEKVSPQKEVKSAVKKGSPKKTFTSPIKEVNPKKTAKSPVKKVNPKKTPKSPVKKVNSKKTPKSPVKKVNPKKTVQSPVKKSPQKLAQKGFSKTSNKTSPKKNISPKDSTNKKSAKVDKKTSTISKKTSVSNKKSESSPIKSPTKTRKRKAEVAIEVGKKQKIATNITVKPVRLTRTTQASKERVSQKRKSQVTSNIDQENKPKRGRPRKHIHEQRNNIVSNDVDIDDIDSSINNYPDNHSESQSQQTGTVHGTVEKESISEDEKKDFSTIGDSPTTECENTTVEVNDDVENKGESMEVDDEVSGGSTKLVDCKNTENKKQNIESNNDETNSNNDIEGESEESDIDDAKKHGESKTKSLFSYYDKQKKTSENIFKDSKKSTIRFEEDDNPPNILPTFSDTKNVQQSSTDEQPQQCATPTKQDTSTEQTQKKIKSPFKSLKGGAYRRFSALPTNISMFSTRSHQDEEDEDSAMETNRSVFQSTNIFGQSAGSSSFKVRRDEKELFTVVRDTKHAYQCLEHGESQLFKDDLEYLLDGLKSNHNTSTRCLTALELASKCMAMEFRMHIKAHGLIEAIFVLLQDAHSDELLALCTCAIIFILSKDRLKTGFDKKIVAFVLKLSTKTSSEKSDKKTYEKIHNKTKSLFEKYGDPYIDINNITASVLARETLLSLTSQKTGEWFKEELRTLGGLDHISDSIYANSKSIQKKTDTEENYSQSERSLLLLCDITFKNAINQKYLGSYRDGLLLESCIRILTLITSKTDLVHDFTKATQNCLFAVLRFLTNMSHENESGSIKICKQDDALKCFLRCVLYMPQFLADDKSFDFIVVALGLLINLTEHSKQNTAILNNAFGPACYESESSSSINDDIAPVEALTQLFLVRNEACKEGDLMEELEKLEKEQDDKDSSMHYHVGEDALICGDKFDDTVAEESADSKEDLPSSSHNTTAIHTKTIDKNEKVKLNQKEEQDVRNTLEKAHRHMEDSHVAAYSALLIGLLAENNKDNQETIHSLLPDGDFKPMYESLEKILAFMRMTGATDESGFKVIERVIDVFKVCGQTYSKNAEENAIHVSSQESSTSTSTNITEITSSLETPKETTLLSNPVVESPIETTSLSSPVVESPVQMTSPINSVVESPIETTSPINPVAKSSVQMTSPSDP